MKSVYVISGEEMLKVLRDRLGRGTLREYSLLEVIVLGMVVLLVTAACGEEASIPTLQPAAAVTRGQSTATPLPPGVAPADINQISTSQPCFLGRNLAVGDQNIDVMKLEVYLESVHKRQIFPDEVFDNKTAELVQILQRKGGLEPTGNLNEQTRTAIFPCPVSGKIRVLRLSVWSQITDKEGKTWRTVLVQYDNTLEFPENSNLFRPYFSIGLKNAKGTQACGLLVKPFKKGKDITESGMKPGYWQDVELTDNHSGWASWCRVLPGNEYYSTITILPEAIGNTPGTDFKATDFIHPDFVDVLSDIADKAVRISPCPYPVTGRGFFWRCLSEPSDR